MTESTEKKTRKGWRIILALTVIAALALVAFGYWYWNVRGLVKSEDARIDGDLVDVAPQIGGVLDELHVREGELVKKGQDLFKLDSRALEATFSRMEADAVSARSGIEVARAQYEKTVNGPLPREIQIAESESRRAESSARLATTNWTRANTLFETQAITEAERDRVKTEWETAKQTAAVAGENLRLLREGTRHEDIDAARATLDQRKAALQSAEAAVSQARVNLDYARVQAPFDGVVVRKWRDPGATVSAGAPVVTLLNPSSLHVSANIEEKNLGRVHTGDRVDITIDAYRNLKVTGRVEQILRATNSRFSLIPSEGVSGTFIKVAQRVPVLIKLDPAPRPPLGPGLSVEVRIHTTPGSAHPVEESVRP